MKNLTIHTKIKTLSVLVLGLIIGGASFVAFSLNYFQTDLVELQTLLVKGGHFKEVLGLEEKFTSITSFLGYFSYFILGVSGVVAAITGVSFFWLNKSITSVIEDVIVNLKTAYSRVDDMANNVANSSEGLSHSSTQQASAIQETASSIQEISAMVTKNSESAQLAQELSTSSQDELNLGQREVQEMIKVVSDIEKSNKTLVQYIHTSHDKFSEIVDVIGEISNKTNVINDIVFQTKLLSFNASVEAARAGEHGKGFAVVAEEVGNLAQMSGASAREISDMLDMSVGRVNDIIKQTQKQMEGLLVEGARKIKEGTQKAGHTGQVLQGIIESSGEVNVRVTEISTASQEQATGVSEVTRAISDLDQTTQQNMKISNQNLDYSKQLQDASKNLNNVIFDLEKLMKKSKNEVVKSQMTSADNIVSITEHKNKKEKQQDAVTNTVQEVEVKQVANGSLVVESIDEAPSELGVPSSDDPNFEDL